MRETTGNFSERLWRQEVDQNCSRSGERITDGVEKSEGNGKVDKNNNGILKTRFDGSMDEWMCNIDVHVVDGYCDCC